MSTAVVLFCDNFRIFDNPPLYHACKNHDKVVLVYIHNPCYLGRQMGEASKVFLHHVLIAFNDLLKHKYNASLTIFSGDEVKNLQDLRKSISFDAIYFNNGYTKQQKIMQSNLMQFCSVNGISGHGFDCNLLFKPNTILTGSGEGFKIFTPFSKKCIANYGLIQNCLNASKSINSIDFSALTINDLKLLPSKDWYVNLMQNYNINYDKILQNFDNFVANDLAIYQSERNNLGGNSNSKISPFLRFGLLSVRYCFNSVLLRDSNSQFLMELLWREFAYHTLNTNFDIDNVEIRKEYASFQWDDNPKFLTAWQRGQTGYDIVDAAMKELYKTGLMHGRARMITASFLIKDLFCNWRSGEQWFWDTLIDADPAINPFSWQWVFGSGLDGAPYFRIFNPDSQSQRFDANGSYRKKWLGKKYGTIMHAVVNHNLQRQEAMRRYKKMLYKG